MPDDLERLCGCEPDAIVSAPPSPGVHRIGARFAGPAYDLHRHDTYAIGMTLHGVQSFWYRGALRRARAGQTLVLHPDEPHDGQAGDETGLGYRMLYLAPSRLREALPPRAGLPFVAAPVLDDASLRRTLRLALADLEHGLDDLASDQLVGDLATILQRHAGVPPQRAPGWAMAQVTRARDYIDAHWARTVCSAELEAASGLDRFSLLRQFRAVFGTTPYRYLLARRVTEARRRLEAGDQIADVAAATGFADQSHLTRHFRAGLGMSPGRWRKLVSVSP